MLTDITGKKRSKLRSLKTRLFGKTKSKEGGGERKLSQSATDIPQGTKEELELEESFSSNMGSRALSHDSIFLADLCLASDEPPRVLSQENVPSRIKTLQMQLQQQNLRLGQPPLVMSYKRPEDTGGSSEDDGLPQSPPEIVLNDVLPPKTSFKTSSPAAPVILPSSDVGVDFNTPAQFTPCLDNSAARHRMSVKPRNQRASAKVRRLTSPVSRTWSESMNNLDHPIAEKENENGLVDSKEPIRVRSHSSQVLRTEVSPAAPSDHNLAPASYRRSFKEPIVPQQTPTPPRPQFQPRPVLTETVVKTPSGPPTQKPVAKDQKPPMAAGPTSGTEATPVLSPAPDPKKSHMVSETVGTKQPVRTKSIGGTRQVGESLGIYPLKPAPTSGPTTADPQGAPASASAPRDGNGTTQTVVRSRGPVLQNKTGAVGETGSQILNPQTEVCPKVQPATTVHRTSEGLSANGTDVRSTGKNEKTPIKRELGSGTQSAKVSLPAQANKLQAVENVAPSHERQLSGSLPFTITSAHNKDRTRAGSFTGMAEDTGAKRDLTRSNFPQHRSQEQRGSGGQNIEMKAKEKQSPPPSPTISLAKIPKGAEVELRPMQRRTSSSTDLEGLLTSSHEVGEEATESVESQGGTAEDPDGVEEAEEVHENFGEHSEGAANKEEGEKNTFGVKLRSTSLSLKYRLDTTQPDATSKRHSADISTLKAAQGSQAGKIDASPVVPRPTRAGSLTKPAAPPGADSLMVSPAGQNSPLPYPGNNGSRFRSRSFKQEGDTNQPGVAHSPPVERVSASSSSAKVAPTPSLSKHPTSTPLPSKETGAFQSGNVAPTPPSGKEPEATSSDFSWIGAAMEKTRNIQQLITSKLPEGPTLPGASLAKKEFMAAPTVESKPAPSPSVKRKSASSPTKQASCAPLPPQEATPSHSNATTSAAPSVKEPETASSEVSWMDMAREKTKTIQQLFTTKPSEVPGPQTATKSTASSEAQPPVLHSATRPVQPSVPPSRIPKPTVSPEALPTETTQSQTAVRHSKLGQPITKPLPIAGANPKPAPSNASPSPKTSSFIAGTQLSVSPSIPTQPQNVTPKHVGKPPQSQQPTAQSTPPPSLIKKTQPSAPLSFAQSIPRPSQPTANSYLPSSPKPPSYLTQQSQPSPPSVPQGSSDGPFKRRGDVPQPSLGRVGGTAGAEGRSPRGPGMGSKAAFLEKWGDKGASAGNKIEVLKPTSDTQSPPEALTSVRPGNFNRGFKTDTAGFSASTNTVPGSVPLRPAGTDREDRALKRTLAPSSSAQQPSSEGGQPSWMEMAKRKSLAWSDKSME
ncbi:hypothetical protein ACEWY4_023233 [Coilia grayii]|uniref:DUF4592 domain-containing protein n=1 Tax=Coilia grayii TaxID=363190 RepID=A0ABD1J2H8_9TELE